MHRLLLETHGERPRHQLQVLLLVLGGQLLDAREQRLAIRPLRRELLDEARAYRHAAAQVHVLRARQTAQERLEDRALPVTHERHVLRVRRRRLVHEEVSVPFAELGRAEELGAGAGTGWIRIRHLRHLRRRIRIRRRWGMDRKGKGKGKGRDDGRWERPAQRELELHFGVIQLHRALPARDGDEDFL